ncbi:cytochrome P450 (plasmid) [Prescottella equi]|uniref:Cytochrome P450 n=2 Tax=Rhodococcus hoagii TaxID=43767 RepID=A0A9Q2UZY0_RHOHA|nr:cytochrome P450 [Prescottella equi]AVR64902.1 Bifunctional cytochrome P450/NADPH--P450 reductase [Prescottella equi]MBM4479818.1 cytochrome P450 [Prescottella equi]MBM4487695.1 cytochrome P450 [Prescottella equi]MBM4495174.1 cytochrome P450 [Prescottella equi]MBM4498359.1 cytochrome P450 [Prescottella equi]
MGKSTIPHPPRRVPLIGDVFGMDQETPNQTTLKRFEELGPIYRRSILGTDLTFVGSAELAAQVFDDTTWEKHVGRPLERLRPLVADGLFTAYNWESNWSKAHEVLVPGFTKDAMVSYHGMMVDVVEELCKDLENQPAGEYVPVVDEMGKLTLEVIGRCGFGYSFDSFGGHEHPFVAAMTRSLTYAQKSAIPVPFVGKLLGRKDEQQNAADRRLLNETVDEVIAARQTSGERRSDLLDRMLHPEAGEGLDAENIRNQVLTFLVAGHETSVNALSFALHFIGQNPDIAARMRAEAEDIIGTGPVRYEDVPRLRYTRQVINEALRLWPTAPGFFRAAKQDTEVGGHAFAAGEWVFVLLLAVQRDPAWGPDADKFNPDRFSPENTRGRPAELFKPFGTGIRSCIGRQFALHEMTLALATLVQRFDITPEPDYALEVEETLTLRPKRLNLQFTPR